MTPQRLAALDLPPLGASPPTKQQLMIAVAAVAAIEKWPAEMSVMLQALFGFCPADRWSQGAHALVWPGNRQLCDRTGYSLGQVRHWLDRLFDRNLIAILDDANGQRRNSLDPITRAPRLPFGIRLSPLAHQYEAFLEILREHQEERCCAGEIARNLGGQIRRIHSILDFLEGEGFGDQVNLLRVETETVGKQLRRLRRSHRACLQNIRRLHDQGEALFARARVLCPSPETLLLPESAPQGAASDTPYRITKSISESKDSVAAAAASRASGKEEEARTVSIIATEPREPFYPRPGFVARIAPTLGSLIRTERPVETDVIEAAYQLLNPLGISQGAWSEACSNRGRYHAAVLVAVIAEKHQAQQLRSPGAYLRGLVARDRTGRLNLDHSLFALRDRADRLHASQNASRGFA